MITEDERRHIGLVRELSKPGGPLDKGADNASLRNPAWYRHDGSRRANREASLNRMKAEVVGNSPNARNERRALVLAGPPGAGKGSVAEAVLGEDRDHYVNIDADEFKKLLLQEAIADGSYEGWIKPSEVRDLEARGEKFHPLELASLVHEESARLSRIFRTEMIAQGKNIIVDTVLSDPEMAVQMGEHLAEAGYQVTVVDVEVPFEVSEDRIVQRWQHAMREAESGKGEALGGRWVPSSYARPLFDTEHGRSKSQDAALQLAQSCPRVVRYERYFTSVEEHRASLREGRAAQPVREEAQVRQKPGAELKAEQSVAPLRAASFAQVKAPSHGASSGIQRSELRPRKGPRSDLGR
ncbi:MAG: zeta toxin family protein [Dermabacter sp.]|nr:zeta toxin family protein [Dermabacter sp.]